MVPTNGLESKFGSDQINITTRRSSSTAPWAEQVGVWLESVKSVIANLLLCQSIVSIEAFEGILTEKKPNKNTTIQLDQAIMDTLLDMEPPKTKHKRSHS